MNQRDLKYIKKNLYINESENENENEIIKKTLFLLNIIYYSLFYYEIINDENSIKIQNMYKLFKIFLLLIETKSFSSFYYLIKNRNQ